MQTDEAHNQDTTPPSIQALASVIELLVLDVDGVMTDGRLYFSNHGEELKAFDIQDGLGIKLLQQQGVHVAIITGRQSALVANRAENLGIRSVIQGREDKLQALDELRSELALEYTQIAYLGDDLPDLSAIRAAGLGMAVGDAHHFVANYADWQTRANGGQGAVRETCELILAAKGQLKNALENYL